MTLLEASLHKIRVDCAEVVSFVVGIVDGDDVSGHDALLEGVGVVLGPLIVLLFWLGHVGGGDKLKSLPG